MLVFRMVPGTIRYSIMLEMIINSTKYPYWPHTGDRIHPYYISPKTSVNDLEFYISKGCSGQFPFPLGHTVSN